ncbi:MAG TPA: response regulator transcription factor [Opitutaceae bacterium]|nr:response regulator transcription factor [Opitutaceae bacterium]
MAWFPGGVTHPARLPFFRWRKIVMSPKILVVDDEPDAREVLGFNLQAAGFVPVYAADGVEALAVVRSEHPALLVLDLMLPQVDGLEVCRRLRQDAATSKLPILMLTARTSEMDRVIGLELGADDYVTKPFSPREVVIRIRKLLARAAAPEDPAGPVCFGELEIDPARREVRVESIPVVLTATEFRLLQVLVRHDGRVQTRERLLRDVWGHEQPIDSRTVDTHMRRLREKMGSAARFLETIRGVGYRFRSDSPAGAERPDDGPESLGRGDDWHGRPPAGPSLQPS